MAASKSAPTFMLYPLNAVIAPVKAPPAYFAKEPNALAPSRPNLTRAFWERFSCFSCSFVRLVMFFIGAENLSCRLIRMLIFLLAILFFFLLSCKNHAGRQEQQLKRAHANELMQAVPAFQIIMNRVQLRIGANQFFNSSTASAPLIPYIAAILSPRLVIAVRFCSNSKVTISDGSATS